MDTDVLSVAILLHAEASLLIPDRPFLIGIEGPDPECFVYDSCSGSRHQRQATCYSVISSIEFKRLGTSSWFRWGTD